VKLRRSELYSWVWATPVARVAQRLNISGSALLKTCKRHRIPTPPRGYWRQLQVGQIVEATPLPDPENDYELPIVIDESTGSELMPGNGHGIASAKASVTESQGGVGATEFAEQSPVGNGADGVRRESVEPPEVWLGPEQILLLASRHQDVQMGSRLLDEVQESARLCEPATEAVIALWVARARETLSQCNPVAQIVESCRRVARGDQRPTWWASSQRRSRDP